jgi:hypothetical protein
MAQMLLDLAAQVNPAKLRKHPRSTQKEKKPKGYAPASEVRRHIATARARAAGTVDYDSRLIAPPSRWVVSSARCSAPMK